jgi:UDP:flavonoid glycosyltransferase YjiC (YdhE family)
LETTGPVPLEVAHIVFVAHGLISPLNAGLELSRRLTDHGHDVTFMSHADISHEVEAHGFAFVQLASDESIRREARSGGNPLARLRGMRRTRSRSIANEEFERALTALDPDLLLIDLEMHYATIVSAHLHIPTMLVMNWLSVFRQPGLPPLNSKLSPPRGASPGETRFRRAWIRVQLAAWGARIRHKIGRGGVGDVLRPVTYGTNHYADLKQVAKAHGYSLKDNTNRNEWVRPFMYTRLPVLCLNALELEFPHTPHPNIRYVGPMVNRHRLESRLQSASRLHWDAYRAARSANDGGRPLVYCSLGSYWSDAAFLRMVIATFERRPEWDLVLGLGGQATEGDLGPIPDNVLLLDWAPQLEVLELADCAINHGGITSINECITSGVPMVVYSPSLVDQDGCATRIEYHGLGVDARWSTKEPERLEQHVARVLSDQAMRGRVRAMRRVFDRYSEEATVVAVIEDFLVADRGKAAAEDN